MKRPPWHFWLGYFIVTRRSLKNLTDGQMARQADGRNQMQYLPALLSYAVNNKHFWCWIPMHHAIALDFTTLKFKDVLHR